MFEETVSRQKFTETKTARAIENLTKRMARLEFDGDSGNKSSAEMLQTLRTELANLRHQLTQNGTGNKDAERILAKLTNIEKLLMETLKPKRWVFTPVRDDEGLLKRVEAKELR